MTTQRYIVRVALNSKSWFLSKRSAMNKAAPALVFACPCVSRRKSGQRDKKTRGRPENINSSLLAQGQALKGQ